jgi:nucleoside-diphosphate-sugar epimerase
MAKRRLPSQVRLVDRGAGSIPRSGFHWYQAGLTDRAALADAITGADRIIHLAALPGAASEADPTASRQINLDASLALINLLECHAGPNRPRLVYASSIAVIGAPSGAVGDSTPPAPDTTYGTHKFMVEIAIADAVRRDRLDAISLRLPGIVARPPGAGGFGSSFMSEVFQAVRAGEPWTSPVGPDATMWLMSATACADALIHGAFETTARRGQAAITLPALRVSMADLIATIAAATGRDDPRVRFKPDPAIEARFAQMPPLATPVADARGFRHDGDLATLVARALAGCSP